MNRFEKEREEVEEVWERKRRSWRGLKEAEKEELCVGNVGSEWNSERVFGFWFNF